jgi:REP-associated tyrosine transposase
VCVTKYQHRLFNDAMPTFTQNTMRAACAQLGVAPVEFNGETDHVHLLIAYPPSLAISTLVQRLKIRTAHAVRRESTGAGMRAHMSRHWHRSCRPRWPLRRWSSSA